MRTLSLGAQLVCALGALAGCQQGEASRGAISLRRAEDPAPPRLPVYDPWAPHAEWLMAPAPAGSGDRLEPHDPPWKPGESVEFEVIDDPKVTSVAAGVTSAMHASNISVLALTDDGTAAVTADTSGSARFWPSLDGTREPVVIPLAGPGHLAIVRDHDELAIAAIDRAGQLELLRLAKTGEIRGHSWVEAARPFEQVHAVGSTFVLVRDDHAVTVVDAGGAQLGTLVSDPGEHLASVTCRHGRALAMLDSEAGVRGRWIDIGATAAWGERTPMLPIRGGDVALSPDGTRIAAVNALSRAILIVNLASGEIVRRTARRDFPDRELHPAGFLDDRVLAMNNDLGGFEWIGRESPDEQQPISHAPVAVADRVAVFANMGSLVLAGTRGPERSLGYQMGSLYAVVSTNMGLLATDGTAITEIDGRLRTRVAHEVAVADAGRTWTNVLPIDETHVVAEQYADSTTGLFVIDVPAGKATLITLNAHASGYEPSTGLLEFSTRDALSIAKFDPKTGQFGATVSLALEPYHGLQVTLLDPAAASGYIAAVTTRDTPTRPHVSLIKSIVPGRDVELEIGKQRDFDVEEAFWSTHTEIALIERMLPNVTWKQSPDRDLNAQVHDLRITLRDRDGRERWTVPAHGATDVLWTHDGTLVAYGAGMARLDLATGELRERQCGWRFGLWKTPIQTFGLAQQCEAP